MMALAMCWPIKPVAPKMKMFLLSANFVGFVADDVGHGDQETEDNVHGYQVQRQSPSQPLRTVE